MQDGDRGRSGMLLISGGVGATLLVLGIWAWLGMTEACPHAHACQRRFLGLRDAPFNEIDDAVAGVGSLLAFIWLFVAVMLQFLELRAQRAEWVRMGTAMREQAEVLQDERNRRDQAEAARQVAAICGRLARHPFLGAQWAFREGTSEVRLINGPLPALDDLDQRIEGIFTALATAEERVGALSEKLRLLHGEQSGMEMRPCRADAESFLKHLEAIKGLTKNLAVSDRIAANEPHLNLAISHTRALLARRDFWTEREAAP